MKIRKLRIQNLNSLRLEQTIDFAQTPLVEAGLFAIIGDTGAGKTTILDALTLALYGKVHRNKDVKEVMSYGAIESQAEVEFETNGGLYLAKWRIYRSRKKADGNIRGPERELGQWNDKKKQFEIIAEKNRETDLQVEAVTGLDYDRFCRSVLLSQGDFAAFLKANERDRSDLLERITGTEIYTRLSKAAFERHKLEAQNLEQLEAKLATLKVLTSEEIEAYQEELKGLNQQEKTLQQELNQQQTAIQWLKRLEELQLQEQQLKTFRLELEEKKQASLADFQKLEQAQLAVPFQGDLNRIDDASQALAELSEEIKHLLSQQIQQQASSQQIETLLTTEGERLTALEEEWQKKQPILDKVAEMDVEIREKKEPHLENEKKLQAQKAELEEAEEKKGALHQQITNLEISLDETGKWLKENVQLQQLPEELPAIEFQRENMRNLLRQQKQMETLIQNDADKKTQLTASLQIIEKNYTNLQTSVEALQKIFKQTAPENYAENRSEYLTVLFQEIEKLGENRKKLGELHRLSSEYQTLLNELSGFEEQLEYLQREDLGISKELMSSLELLDNLNQELEYKQQVYDQQQLIANYEKDRSNLKEGAPCPLCLSTEHPFRTKPFKPYIDKARQELEKVKRQSETAYEQHRSLLRRQNEVENQIEQLSGNELKQLSGQLAKQFQRLLTYEEQIAFFVPDFKEESDQLNSIQYLLEKISATDQQIVAVKKVRDELAKLNRELDTQEKEWLKLETEKKELVGEIRILDEKIKLNTDQLREIKEKFEDSVLQINQGLKKYGFVFAVDTAADMFEELKQLKSQYETKSKQFQEQTQSKDLIALELKQIETQLTKGKASYEKALAEHKNQAEKITTLEGERKSLLGEVEPATYKSQMLNQLKEGRTHLESLKNQMTSSRLQLEGTSQLIQEKRSGKKKSEGKIGQLQNQLQDQIQKKGFAGIDALRLALLTPEEQQQLENQKKELENALLANEQSIKDTLTAFEKEQKKQLTEASIAEAEATLQKTNSEYQLLLQSLGALKEKLEQNAERTREAKTLLEEIAVQKNEHQRWAKLNDVIGMADGKKFRIFAQGLTLSKLIQLANRHLERLNGRYIIQKRSDEDLELEIVDTFQADNRRSMNTLSGGESFLVSLALALGLSDLAGRNTQIKSLFIDEGFGTLDENSLDMAISTLENLQASGKSIGVISHVKALKERISTQIQVQKKGNGVSEIQIIG